MVQIRPRTSKTRPGAELALWIVLAISAGICEAAVYRGYFQQQFIELARNVPAGIILSAALSGGAHSHVGLWQALQISLLGAMSGILAQWRGSVRPGMITHALQDVLGAIFRFQIPPRANIILDGGAGTNIGLPNASVMRARGETPAAS